MSFRSLIAVLVLFAFGATTVAAGASTTVNGSANPIVSWNASTTGTLYLYPNYNPSTGQTNVSGIGTVVAATNAGYTGAGGCTSAPTQTSNIINYSNVSVPTGTNVTACDYKNALSIGVQTNDAVGWNVTQQLQLAPGTGFTLCALPNGSLYSGTPSAGSPMPSSSITGASAAINEGSCSGSGQQTLGTNSTTPALNTIIATQTSATGTYYQGEDVLLLLTATTIAIGTYSATMTVTLTLN
jgi:hypothetical protein